MLIVCAAEREWKEKLARQSDTLEEAVVEYKRRYNRRPPAGFDRWWTFCKDNNVQLPDEYDTIMDLLEPFYALHPDVLRSRNEELPTMQVAQSSFTYKIDDHNATWNNLPKAAGRIKAFTDLLQPLAPLLPDLSQVACPSRFQL